MEPEATLTPCSGAPLLEFFSLAGLCTLPAKPAVQRPYCCLGCGGVLDGGVLELPLLSGVVLLVPLLLAPVLDSAPPGEVAPPVAEPGVIPK